MTNVIVCKKCKKSLRVNGPIPAGKAITCPACQTRFVTGAQPPPVPTPGAAGAAGATGASAAQAKAPAQMKAAPKPPAPTGISAKPPMKKAAARVDIVEEVEDVEETAAVRSRKRRPDPDEDDDRPRRRDHDDDDDDDRDRRRKKKRQKSGGSLGLVLGLTGAGVLLVALLVTGFVWPGFFLSARDGAPAMAVKAGGAVPGAAVAPGEANPLAFLPGDANMIVGINVTQVRTRPVFFQGLWNGLQEPGEPLGDVPPELRNVLGSADSAMLASNFERSETPIIVIGANQPYDAEKIKPVLGAPVTLHGKTIYPYQTVNQKRTLVGMPSPKVLVLSQLPDEQFAALLARADKVHIHADLQQQIAANSSAPYWFSLYFDERLKQRMQPALQDPGAGAPQEIINLTGAVARGKGVNLTADMTDNQNLKLTLGLTCNDANDAGVARQSAQSFWTMQGPKVGDAVRLMGGNHLTNLVNEFSRSLTFDQRDTTATMSVQLGVTTLQQVAKGPDNPRFGVPFGPRGFNPPVPPFFGPGNLKKKSSPPPFRPGIKGKK